MSWFTQTEDYSLENNRGDFYPGPEITYDYSYDESSSSSTPSSSSSSDWDTYQHERESISAYWDQHTR